MYKVAKPLLLFTCLVFMPTLSYGQAAIAGLVKDTSGAVLPGVTVEATSPALIEKVRSVVTDGTGRYQVVNLVPGTYTVTFVLPGFNTVRRGGIELTGSFVATVDIEMRVGALEETITVTGETPTVDVQSTLRQRVLDREVIDNVPTSRVPITLAAMVPAVSDVNGSGTALAQDVGGSSGRTSNSLVSHGSKPVDMRLTYNGLTLANLETGKNAGLITNTQAYQEVTVDYSAVSAELATGGVRVNLIPKEGGNSFHGVWYTSFMNEHMQGTNITQEMKDRGLKTPDSIKKLLDINPGFGGPVARDKLWFYFTAQYFATDAYAGIFANRNAGNPNAWTYEADTSRRISSPQYWADAQLRLTWQATPKNKLAASYDYQWGDQRSHGSPTQAEETITSLFWKRNYIANFDWTAPVTNRLLLDAVWSRQLTTAQGDTPGPLVGVVEQSTGLRYRGWLSNNLAYWLPTNYYRASVSYITGSHALKAGFNGAWGSRAIIAADGDTPLTYRFNNGVPNQITLRATPWRAKSVMNADNGIYAQDKWTIDRLTLALGARFDYYKSSYPDQPLVPTQLLPTRSFTLAAQDGVRGWKDLTPKLGASYDLSGNGKTAVKITLNKYMQGQALGGDVSDRPFGFPLNPVDRVVQTTTRSWNDANRDFIPDCNLADPRANGECGALANSSFGQPVYNTTYDPAILGGWGKRAGFSWEFSTGVQRELIPRVSVDVGYFRRWYGNLVLTDNLTTAPSDYDPFSITAPLDPRLPGGGGYVISGLYDLNSTKFGLPANNWRTYSDNYGKQLEHWNGVDVGVSARLQNGLLIQGGLSTGKKMTDNCGVVAKLDNPSKLYCHVEQPFQTQLKVQSSYTIRIIDVQVSGNFQSFPGAEILANYNAPNAVVAPALGRSLSGGAANVTVPLIPPASMYGGRHNQLDLRFGKILRFGRAGTSLNFDVYNALNANSIVAFNPNYGSFLQPTSILPARFLKLSLQADF